MGEPHKINLGCVSAYALAMQQGFEGTLDEWLASLKPIKGVDYFTDADMDAIVAAVVAILPNGDEVSY